MNKYNGSYNSLMGKNYKKTKVTSNYYKGIGKINKTKRNKGKKSMKNDQVGGKYKVSKSLFEDKHSKNLAKKAKTKKQDVKAMLKEAYTLNFETMHVADVYSADIIKCLKARDNELTPVNFLDRHNISKNLRAKMVDWMIEVLCSYKCKN